MTGTYHLYVVRQAYNDKHGERSTDGSSRALTRRSLGGQLRAAGVCVDSPRPLAKAAREHGWSRNVLALQIDGRARKRHGKALTNFKATLPPAHSDMAIQVFKDPYLFDFLGTANTRQEREIEQALVDHIQRFVLELGTGFAFVGRQVLLEVGDHDFVLDLLFSISSFAAMWSSS